MSESYPLPSYAAHVWSAADALVIQFPPLASGEAASTIRFPMTERGVAAMLRILRERARAVDLRIGTPGTPTKREVERAIESDAAFQAWSKALDNDKARLKAETESARTELAELGL